jgi:hypothetical protein
LAFDDMTARPTRLYRCVMEIAGQRSNPQLIKRGCFVLLVLAFILFTALLTPVPFLILGWFVQLGPGETSHRVHEIAFGALFLLPLVGLVVQLRRPETKIAPMYQVVIPLLFTIFVVAVLAGEPDPSMALFLVVPLLLVLLHPARARLLRPQFSFSPVLLALALAAAIPLLFFAVDQLRVSAEAGQIAPRVFDSLPEDATDAQVERAMQKAASGEALEAIEHYGHWSAMGAFAISIVASALIAASRMPGWRFTAWSAAAVVAVYGVASLVFPEDASAKGGLWGLLAILWAAAFVVVSLRESTPAEAAPAAVTPSSPAH